MRNISLKQICETLSWSVSKVNKQNNVVIYPDSKRIVRRRLEISRAIVLFTVESGSENYVLQDVKKVEGVEEAYIAFGVYDVAAKVYAGSLVALKEIITNKLRQISRVRSTVTLMLIEE